MRAKKTAPIHIVTFGMIVLSVTVAAAQTKLLRFPDIHGNQVVFCHEPLRQ